MASQPFISVVHKRLHLNLLLAFTKRPLNALLTVVSPGQQQLREISKTTGPAEPNVSGSTPTEHETDNCRESRQDCNQQDSTRRYNIASHSESTEDAAFRKSLRKIKPSSGSQKYFKQSWLSHYKSLVPEADTTRSDDSDQFGTLSSASENIYNSKKKYDQDERDPNERLNEMIPEDVDEPRDRRLNIPLTRDGRIGKNAYYYTRKMSILGRQGKIRDAIAVFDHWMMLRDRVMPNKRTFIVLIGIVGRAGYTDKAFELYSKMRNLGLDAEDQVYTSLFNACANSPWPQQSLKPAENLLNALQARGVHLSLITVKAAAKAMAFCGNFPRAFTIMDEASSRLGLDAECFDHLLMACAADKQAGFSRALQVWQKLQEFDVTPQTNTYNLLIRTARDCGIGDPDMLAKVLGLSSGNSELPHQTFLTGPTEQYDSSSIENKDAGRFLLAIDGSTGTRPFTAKASGKQINGNSQNEERASTAKLSTLKVPNIGEERDSPSKASSHTASQERHNLYHDIPDFDKNMDSFLLERDVLHKREGAASLYEWWEVKPEDAQQVYLPQVSGKTNQVQTESMATAKSGMVTTNMEPSTVANLRALDKTELLDEKELGQSLGDLPSGVPDTDIDRESPAESLRVKDIEGASQRLALLGGARRLVRHMAEAGAAPDVRTFSQLVTCLPDAEEAELDLLVLMEELGVKPDVDLINDLMMKRNFRHSSHTARELLPVMSKLGLVPNMRTYSSLALTCLKEHEAHRLLRDMKAANLEPCTEIMGHFIYISRTNFSYKLHMLYKMEELGLSPVPETIRAIEKSIAITKRNIIAAEKRKDLNSHYLSSGYQDSFRRFLRYYRGWLQRTSMHKRPHPWKAFQQQERERVTDNTL